MNTSSIIRALVVAGLLAGMAGGPAARAQQPESGAGDAAPKQYTDEELGEMFARALVLHKFGRYDDAEPIARIIVEQRPDSRDARQLLTDIQNARRSQPAPARVSELQRRLAATLLPAVNFREAVAQDVLEFLRAETARLSPDKQPFNFVWMVPADTPLPRVTLVLSNIPVLDVLRYTTELTGLAYRVETHAVVIYKPGAAPGAAHAAPSPAPSHVQPE
jgi:hypothetical protein